jgi:6-pyruvoyltetrahydropterin/6-carboxytetrahydropterin synthase
VTYAIQKDFAFSASHQLLGMPAGHQCARLHGHNYVVQVRVMADELDEYGFVMDYGDLAPVKQFIDTRLDHQHLNDVLPQLVNPTAEHLAAYLASVVEHKCPIPSGATVMVGVSETPKTWAWFG